MTSKRAANPGTATTPPFQALCTAEERNPNWDGLVGFVRFVVTEFEINTHFPLSVILPKSSNVPSKYQRSFLPSDMATLPIIFPDFFQAKFSKQAGRPQYFFAEDVPFRITSDGEMFPYTLLLGASDPDEPFYGLFITPRGMFSDERNKVQTVRVKAPKGRTVCDVFYATQGYDTRDLTINRLPMGARCEVSDQALMLTRDKPMNHNDLVKLVHFVRMNQRRRQMETSSS